MRQETRTLYTIDELTPEARARAIENNRDWNIYDDWHEYTIDDFAQCAAAIGFTVDPRKGVRFTGFYSQGDGASFSGRYEYTPEWRSKLAAHCPTESDLYSIGEELERLATSGGVDSAAVTADGRYCHEMTMRAECWTGEDGDESTDAATAEFLDAARDLARWLYRRLEHEHDYLCSDDAVEESLAANAMEFLADGGRP